MTKEKLLRNIFEWGIMAAVVAMAMPEMAWAQQGSSAGASLNTFKTTDLAAVPAVLSGIAYAGGAVLAISGALKLKAHAENPAQEKMAPGIARLLAGGGIAALPYLLGTAANTVHLQQQIQPTALPAMPG